MGALASKASRRGEGQAVTGYRMYKSQIAGMQQQAGCLGGDIRRRIQRIAQHGMPQGLQMHAQLVAAPGNGL